MKFEPILEIRQFGPTFFHVVDWFFAAFNVFQAEFVIDDLDVSDWVDFAFDVGDVVVLEHPEHVEDRVAPRNVRQERVAQTLALIRSLHQAGDVDHVQIGRNLHMF